jgi:hypothetical protein
MCVVQSMQFPRKHGRVLVNVAKYGSGIRFDLKEKEKKNIEYKCKSVTCSKHVVSHANTVVY